MPNPAKRSISWWWAVLPIAALSVFLAYMLRSRIPAQAPVEQAYDAFNVEEIPEDEPAAAPGSQGYVSTFERRAARRMGEGPAAGAAGLAGLVPEKSALFKRTPEDERVSREQWERQFVEKHGSAIAREESRLKRITDRYRKQHKVVRDVDRAFGKLPRYMEIKRRYEQDRNPFAFARDAIRLPEVRRTIRAYALKPDVWKVTLGMMSEGLKGGKPPKPVYDEMVKFMTHDDDVTKFVMDTTTWLMPKMGRIAADGIPQGVDIGPLKTLAKELDPSGGSLSTQVSGAAKAPSAGGTQSRRRSKR